MRKIGTSLVDICTRTHVRGTYVHAWSDMVQVYTWCHVDYLVCIRTHDE